MCRTRSSQTRKIQRQTPERVRDGDRCLVRAERGWLRKSTPVCLPLAINQMETRSLSALISLIPPGVFAQKNQQPLLLHLSPSRRPTDERTPERIRPRPPDPAMDGASRPPLPPGAGVRVRAPLVSSAPLPFSSRSSLGGARFLGGVRRGSVLGSKAPPLGRKLRSFGSGMRGLGVRDWRFWWIPSRLGVSGSERLATWRHGLWFAWFLVAFFCAVWLMGNR